MSATAIRHPYWYAPQSTHHVCIDDELTNAELSAIALAKLKLNGNGNHSAQQSLCDCHECRIGGKRYALHRPTDCEYTRYRSMLVEQAAKNANRRVTVGYGDKIGEAADRWTKVFASEMDRLSEQLAL